MISLSQILPFSLKDMFLQRALSLKKPFMLLLPITTLEGLKRNKIFREKPDSIIGYLIKGSRFKIRRQWCLVPDILVLLMDWVLKGFELYRPEWQ